MKKGLEHRYEDLALDRKRDLPSSALPSSPEASDSSMNVARPSEHEHF